MSEWTPISGYTPQNYTDTLTYKVHSSTKQVEKVTGQALVAGEKNSQYICFTWDRFWDGIDISTKTFSIDYALAGQYYGTSDAVNAEMSDNEIRFGWIVPENACAISGTLLFVLKVESEDYVLKTQIGETPVWKTINVEDVVPEPTKEAWYRDFEERVGLAIHSAESALAQAQTAVETAVASAESAQEASATAQEAMIESKVRYGSPLVAKTINDMVEQNRVYVYAGSETGYTFGHWYYYDSDNGVWVDGGVYNGSAVNTDKTLTQGDIPADSKATGDAISELKSGFGDLKEDFTNITDALQTKSDVAWELGNIDYSGNESTSSVRARTVGFIDLDAQVSVSSGGKYGYRFYDSGGVFTESPYFSGNVRFTADTTRPSDIATLPASVKCRIVYRSDPEAAITAQDAVNHITVNVVTSPYPRINALESDVEELQDTFSDYFAETWETGKYSNYDGQVATASNFSLAMIDVENLDGEPITIHSWLNGYAGCPIMRKDGTLLQRTSSSKFDTATEVTFNVTLPTGCGYVYLTTLNGHIDEAYVEYKGTRKYPLAAVETMVLNLSKQVHGSDSNPLFKIDNRPMFIDCFLKVGCIGDSLASGESYYDDNGQGQSGLVDIYPHSWGQYLARMTGNTYYNFSKGGLSTKTWLASQYATDCFDGQHNCTAYIIGLGQNDKNASYTIGTSADIDLTDYNNNADTFYGSYGKIIQKIQELVPKAKIFVVTDPLDSVDSAGYNTAIRAMATIFDNVYIVDIRQYGRDMYYSGIIKQSNRNGHYNTIAYRLMASIIGTYISWIIEHNPLEFKAIEFIDTAYSVTE